MAQTTTITCPQCKKSMKAPTDVEGKKVRCKSCKEIFVARAAPAGVAAGKGKDARPAPAKGAPSPAVKEPDKPDQDEDDAKPYALTFESLAPRCPECANELDPPDARICLHCGYDTHTRTRLPSRKVQEITGNDQFLWLLPGILCVILILMVIGHDVWYLLKIQDVVNKEEFPGWMLCAGATKLWLVIFSLFIMFYAGRFAIKRLILNPSPPEVEEH